MSCSGAGDGDIVRSIIAPEFIRSTDVSDGRSHFHKFGGGLEFRVISVVSH